jgi:NAD(P)-dependent dehydrogenase (short-subunit alcohol dehydrogenase family)
MPAPYDANTTTTELVTDYKALIKNKIILTTGVTPGSLGGSFVQSLAKAEPACLILAGRNTAKLEQCVCDLQTANPKLKTRTLQIDLGSLKSVRSAADQVNSWSDIPAIDVLVNNAGIMATEYGLSEDGVESQFATNHLGPFLFTNLIMGKILRSESPRVVMVTSDGHRLSPVRFDDYNFDVSGLSNPIFFSLGIFYLPMSVTSLILFSSRVARHTTNG